jgi:anthranilate phosphoribosyltransferase
MALAVREVGFAFLFAPALHPAMKHAAAARIELKTRTAFNLLGPLTNPASATVQLIGAPTPQAAELMAVALSHLGLPRGYVVHGDGGLDEISTTGPSTLLGLVHGAIDHRTVEPEEFGVRRATQDELSGGDADSHARIAHQVLSGAPGPHRDVVLVNAAVALMAAGKAADYLEGMALAAKSIDSGAALDVMTRYAAFTQRWRAA